MWLLKIIACHSIYLYRVKEVPVIGKAPAHYYGSSLWWTSSAHDINLFLILLCWPATYTWSRGLFCFQHWSVNQISRLWRYNHCFINILQQHFWTSGYHQQYMRWCLVAHIGPPVTCCLMRRSVMRCEKESWQAKCQHALFVPACTFCVFQKRPPMHPEPVFVMLSCLLWTGVCYVVFGFLIRKWLVITSYFQVAMWSDMLRDTRWEIMFCSRACLLSWIHTRYSYNVEGPIILN